MMRTHSLAAAVLAGLLSLAACAGEDDDAAAATEADVIDAQVKALEQAAKVTPEGATADLLNEQANSVREIEEARKKVSQATR